MIDKVERSVVTREQILSVVGYDPATGEFVWRRRPGIKRTDKSWNGRYSGRPAGAIDGSTGYLQIPILGRHYYAHRIAWFLAHGVWPVDHTDHRDGNKLNNSIANLRAASCSQNLANQRLSRANTSGFKGVSYFKRDQNWRARIKFKGRTIHIGYFSTPEAAHAAYSVAAKKYFGEFARAS